MAGRTIAAGVTTDDVRRAWSAAQGPGPQMWVREIQVDPAQLIVEDEATATLSRVPFTIGAGGEITFADPVPVEIEFVDVKASRGGSMARSRGEIIAAAQAATAAAVQRGALTEARARHWTERAEAGEDVAPFVDALTGVLPPRGAPVTAAAPAGADPSVYAVNPLLDWYRANRPGLVAAAVAEDPDPPRLFGDRDLPVMTASGLDPAILAGLPWPLRRPIAAMADRAAIYRLIDKYSDPDAAPLAVTDLATAGENNEYQQAFSGWLMGRGELAPNRGPQDQPARHPKTGQFTTAGRQAPPPLTVEQLHLELFGTGVHEPSRRVDPARVAPPIGEPRN